MIKKFLRLSLLLGIALTMSTYAKADSIYGQISLIGTNTYDNTSITFNPGTTVGAGTTYGAFNVFDSHAAVQMTSFTYNPFNPTQVFTVSEGSNVLTFTLDSLTTASNTSDGLLLVGNGTFDLNGSESTGSLRLSTQPGGTNTTVTFSATALAPTPEPSTLALLGTGLIGSATALYRRRRIQA